MNNNTETGNRREREDTKRFIAQRDRRLLLASALPGGVKALLVSLVALALSWGVTAALRRIPGAARVI